jgi:thiamine-monophosphate kinase
VSGAPLGEFDLIARCFAPIAAPEALGLLDDAMSFAPLSGEDIVITKDLIVEGVHFFPDDPPASIAAKALNVNLSDLAAKGARPLGFLLGFGRPKGKSTAWLDAFASGLKQASEAGQCPLFGGDTVSAPALTLSVTAIGAVPAGGMLRRQGGNVGDAILVSGTIGDAALGLRLRLEPEADWARALPGAHRAHLLDRYLHPQPRLALAPSLRACASAAMDVSDGLVGDCDKLASRLGRVMDAGDVPLSEAANAAIRHNPALFDIALTGGDDYEVLAAVPPDRVQDFIARAGEAGIAVHRIGWLAREGAGAIWRMEDGSVRSFARRSFVHGEGGSP